MTLETEQTILDKIQQLKALGRCFRKSAVFEEVVDSLAGAAKIDDRNPTSKDVRVGGSFASVHGIRDYWSSTVCPIGLASDIPPYNCYLSREDPKEVARYLAESSVILTVTGRAPR